MTTEIYRKARRHLSRRDSVLKKLISTVGPCTLELMPDGFFSLARAIVAQQISTKAARAITARLEQATGRHGLTPKGILRLSDEKLRGAGLSRSKMKSLRDLAEKVDGRLVPLDRLHQMEDEAVIEALIPVRGIGRWTAEMYLIFSLGRLDVLPVDDLGLRVALQKEYRFKQLPVKKEIAQLAEPWRPYRSIATWYFWRSLAKVPQVQKPKMNE
jgi:DNA-3-methyladenine glycosylase II